MPHRYLNVEEAAAHLHLKPKDVLALVRYDEIPFEKNGDRVVFQKIALDGWASRRLLGSHEKEVREFHDLTSIKHHNLSENYAILPELITPECIDADLGARTKASVLRSMVDLAESTGRVNYPEDLLSSLEERERQASTALAGGIALLHCEHHEPYLFTDSFVALGRCTQSIPFGAPDGYKTRHFFLIGSQDDRIHLHILARLCMLCYHTSLLLDLNDAPDKFAIYDILIAAEQEIIAKKKPHSGN